MAILSDHEIRARMRDDALIQFADPNLAKECSYSFRPGKAFPVNGNDHCVDFEADSSATLPIKPGEMVWVRTRETVKMPIDLAGFWWQTNSLSRLGLMLVNMSMVEPIYKGDLACLFVNFGDQVIVIDSETAIAKMVFIRIGGPVDNPYTATNSCTRRHYDSKLLQLAINQPSSFLKIGDISDNLQNDKERILSVVEERLNTALDEIRTEKNARSEELLNEVQAAKKQAIEEFTTDAPRMIWKSYALAGLGLLILGAAITVAGWARDYAWEDEKKLARAEAEKVVRDRLVIDGKTDVTTLREMEQRIEALETSRLIEVPAE